MPEPAQPTQNSDSSALRFALMVSCSPLSRLVARNALNFAREAIVAGHIVDCVFFYQDGALTGQSAAVTASDDFNARRQWQELASDSEVDLVICSGSAERRGVSEHNLASGFRISGLGRWLEAVAQADRVLTFSGPLP